MFPICLDFKVEKDNEIIHEHSENGNSWVRNAYNMFDSMMNFTTTTGDWTDGYFYKRHFLDYYRNEVAIPHNLTLTCGENSHASGILVGSSDERFDFDDLWLWNPVWNGNTSNRLYYQASNRSFTFDSADNRFILRLSRVFNNNSGGTITVREVGLVASSLILISRDVLNTPIELLNGGQLTVTIRIITEYGYFREVY